MYFQELYVICWLLFWIRYLIYFMLAVLKLYCDLSSANSSRTSWHYDVHSPHILGHPSCF